jgi:hypothetical protein
VTVDGYGTATFLATSSGGAKWSAFCNDVFGHLTFKDFLKICQARLSPHRNDDGYDDLRKRYPFATIPRPGSLIEAEGLHGRVLSAIEPVNYVAFQVDGHERIARVHPLSVRLVEAARTATPEDTQHVADVPPQQEKSND